MKCRICGVDAKKRAVETRSGEKKNLYYCANCDFAFFNKDCTRLIVADRFERERLRTAGLRIPDIKTDFDNGLRQSLEYKKAYIGSADRGKKMLEIGPSWGYFLKVLKRSGIKPVGLEINPVRAEFVRRNLKIPCYERLEELEARNTRFHKIFLFYVIQYIKDPKEYVARLIKLLNKGGHIHMITPNHHDVLKDTWAIEEYQRFFYEKMTVSYHSVRSLQRLLAVLARNHQVSFHIKTKQGYSFLNHVMWYIDRRPRTTGMVGGDRYASGIEEKLKSSPTNLGHKLAKLVKEFNHQYRSVVEQAASGNQIILTIKREI